MFSLMLDCRARINEVVNIKIGNIDINDCSIFLDVTKYDKERYVFFTKELVEVYLKYLSRYDTSEGYLFPNKNRTTHQSKRSVIDFLMVLQKRLNIEHSISSHKLRHTFATKFIEKGGSLPILQDLLGHENIETTMIYVHMNKNQLKEAYDKTMKIQ